MMINFLPNMGFGVQSLGAVVAPPVPPPQPAQTIVPKVLDPRYVETWGAAAKWGGVAAVAGGVSCGSWSYLIPITAAGHYLPAATVLTAGMLTGIAMFCKEERYTVGLPWIIYNFKQFVHSPCTHPLIAIAFGAGILSSPLWAPFVTTYATYKTVRATNRSIRGTLNHLVFKPAPMSYDALSLREKNAVFEYIYEIILGREKIFGRKGRKEEYVAMCMLMKAILCTSDFESRKRARSLLDIIVVANKLGSDSEVSDPTREWLMDFYADLALTLSLDLKSSKKTNPEAYETTTAAFSSMSWCIYFKRYGEPQEARLIAIKHALADDATQQFKWSFEFILSRLTPEQRQRVLDAP